MSYLILRPVSKFQKSARAFAQANIQAVSIGLINTRTDEGKIAQWVASAPSGLPRSMVIVISTTAAHLWAAHRPAEIPALTIAIGPSTATVLEQHGITCVTPDHADTEGLLAMAALQNVQGKEIHIIKGAGGRAELAHVLEQRGAKVIEWPLYQRFVETSPPVSSDWHQTEIHCIIATSGELIEAAFGAFDKVWLRNVPWIVVSERTAKIATTLGVERTFISDGATDNALIECARQLSE